MYLYQINFPKQEEEICKLEMYRLFGCSLKENIIISDLLYEAGRSVYFKARLDILYSNESLDQLCEAIRIGKIEAEAFKVLYLKGVKDGLSYEQRLNAVGQVSRNMLGTFAMKDALVQFGLVYFNQMWYFGYLKQDHQSWQKHQSKPQSYSQSLSARLARTLVNIAVGQDGDVCLIDPCCGVGTVVLEGLAMGFEMTGSDIHKGICWKGNRNLEYFGYPKLIQNKDIADIQSYYDACIIDIPYNLYSHISPSQQLAILKHAHRIAGRFVLISHEEMDDMLLKAYWHIDQRCKVGKMRFERYVYLCDKN